jgi:membrane-associated phospholipid phosphatase
MDDNDDASEFASDYLGPLGLGVVTAGVFVAGQYSDDLVFRDMSYDMGVAVVANLVLTGVLKEGVSRTRPNEGDDQSFPSGHTSNAFAIAAVADAHYGRKAGIPAYVVASLIGVSRIRRDAHWLSDVVAGAALGYLTGTTVVRQNSKTDRKLTFLPSLSPSFQGLVVQGEF